MEVFNGFTIVHLSWRDRTTVRQVFDRNENPIDKERMLRGKVQIATGILIIKSKASDSDRGYAPMPGRGSLLERTTPDPFDRQGTVEGVDESTDCQLFNRNLTGRSQNARADEEAMMIITITTMIIVSSHSLRWFGC